MKKLLSVLALTFVVVFAFSACNMLPGAPSGEDVITVEDGYLVVNGVKTDYQVKTDDVIEVIDGYVYVNGVKTEHKVHTEPVVEVIDGYVAVNGVKTQYQVKTNDVIEVIDGYVYVNGVKTDICVADCSHSWTTVTTNPTCTAGGYDTKTCSLCGRSVTENETSKLDHNYADTYSFDDNNHWFDCIDCDATKDVAVHTPDADNKCVECGILLQPTKGVIYDVSLDGTYAEVIGYEGTASNVIIASEYQGLPVTVIYREAFYGNGNIISVVIPDSVTTIGVRAFEWCSNLSYVIIGKGVNVIEGSAFYGCHESLYTEEGYIKYVGSGDNPYAVVIEVTNKNMSSYTINEKARVIAENAFNSCNRLRSIEIPNGVVGIGNGAFANCTDLSSVVIPDGVITIGSRAFEYCSRLESVIIPDSVTYLGEAAFLYCFSLNSAIISDNVTSIGHNTFDGCHSLSYLVIGKSVTSIGDSAFANCRSLTNIVLPDGLTHIGECVFTCCYQLVSIVIPKSVISIDIFSMTYCDRLESVYYTGSEEDWQAIDIGDNNWNFNDATFYYNYVPEV